MEIAKIIREIIYNISKEDYNKLSLKFENKEEFEYVEKRLFVFEKDEGLYVAIDNRSGDFFHEDFTIEEDAYIWLIDLKCAEVLQRAERNGRDVWW